MITPSIENIFTKLELLSIPPLDLARQLTVLEFHLFSRVKALDLLTSETR